MLIKVLRTGVRDQKVKWEENNFKGLLVHEEPGILNKINTVIEWDFVTYPKKLDNPEEQDLGYLDFEQELKPGDAFSIGEAGNLQIFRIISDNKLGLEHTETGGLSLNRFIEKMLNPEFETIFNYEFGRNDVTLSLFDDIPGNYDFERRIPYDKYKIWSERFFPGRPDCENKIIKLTIDSGTILYPIDIFIKKNSVFFDKNDLLDDTEFVNWVIDSSLAWICNNYPRLVVIEKPKPDQDKDQDKNLLMNLINATPSSSKTQIVNQSLNIQQNGLVNNNHNNSELDEDFGEFNPNEIYHYAVRKDREDEELGEPGELYLYLVKKSIWGQEGAMESSSLDPRFEDMYIPEFSEAMEGIYEVPDKFKTIEEVYSHLSTIPVFEFNQDFEDFINN